MKFEDALTAMREGQTAARDSWDGAFRIKLTPDRTNVVKDAPRGLPNTWQPASLDIAATDWQVV